LSFASAALSVRAAKAFAQNIARKSSYDANAEGVAFRPGGGGRHERM